MKSHSRATRLWRRPNGFPSGNRTDRYLLASSGEHVPSIRIQATIGCEIMADVFFSFYIPGLAASRRFDDGEKKDSKSAPLQLLTPLIKRPKKNLSFKVLYSFPRSIEYSAEASEELEIRFPMTC